MPKPGNASFIVVGPNGEVTYDFAGHISADGLDLTAVGAGAAPEDRKVRWLRESDGARVAEIYGQTTTLNESVRVKTAGGVAGGGVARMDLTADSFGGSDTASAVIQGTNIGGRTAAVRALSNVSNAGTRIEVGLPNYLAKTLLDADGRSDWAFQPAAEAPINNTPGSDVSVNFTCDRIGQKILILFGGSGYATAVGTAYLQCRVDGGLIGEIRFFFNTVNEHTWMGWMTGAFYTGGTNISVGNHTLRIHGGLGLSRDGNDYNSALMLKL